MAKNDEKRLQAGLQLLGYESADAFLQDKKLDPAQAQNPDEIQKHVREALIRDAAAQKRLADLTERVTNESNPLSPDERLKMRAGLALFGINPGDLDKDDDIKTENAALAFRDIHNARDMQPESNLPLTGHQTKMLKGGLALMGHYTGEINARFDNETRDALKAYYAERKVPASTKPAADENALASVMEAMKNNPAANAKMKEIAANPKATKKENSMLQAGLALGGANLAIDGVRGLQTQTLLAMKSDNPAPVAAVDSAPPAAAFAYVEDYGTLGKNPTATPVAEETVRAPVVPVGAVNPVGPEAKVAKDGNSGNVWTTTAPAPAAVSTPATPPSAADIKRAEMENRLKEIEIAQRRIAAQVKGTLDPNLLNQDVENLRKNIDAEISKAQGKQNILRPTDPNFGWRKGQTDALKEFRDLDKERAALNNGLENLNRQPVQAVAAKTAMERQADTGNGTQVAPEEGTKTRRFLFWEFTTKANPAADPNSRMTEPGARLTDVKWVGTGSKDESKPVAKKDEPFVGGVSLSSMKDGFGRAVNGNKEPLAVTAAVPASATRFEIAPAPAGRPDDRTTGPGSRLVLVRDDFGKSADDRLPMKLPQGSYAAGFMESLGANKTENRAQAEINYMAKTLKGERDRIDGPMTLGSAIVTYKVHAANEKTPDNQLGLTGSDQRKVDRLLEEAGLKKSDKLDPQDPNQMRVLLTAISAFANDTTMKNVNQKWQDGFIGATPKAEPLPEGLIRTNDQDRKPTPAMTPS